MPIYVDTDKRYFDANKTGPSKAKAEETIENGAIDEEYRVEYTVDRANTVGMASITSALTFKYQGRDFRLTDVHGKVVKQLSA